MRMMIADEGPSLTRTSPTRTVPVRVLPEPSPASSVGISISRTRKWIIQLLPQEERLSAAASGARPFDTGKMRGQATELEGGRLGSRGLLSSLKDHDIRTGQLAGEGAGAPRIEQRLRVG